MMSAAKHSTLPSSRTVLLATLVVGGLLAACNFPLKKDGATVGSKGLWVASGSTVVEYVPGQLDGGTGATVPHLVNKSSAFGSPQGVTFDANGNLWVLDPAGLVNGATTPALFEFSAGQVSALASNDAPIPIAAITSSFIVTPQQSVFDTGGNMWITDHDSNTVIVFTQSQLSELGVNSLAPVLVISSTAFNGPSGVALDSTGNLWVSNEGLVPGTTAGAVSSAGTTIVEFAATNLPALPETGTQNSTLTPDAILSDDGQSSIQAPWALAFDSAGNLWSSNSNPPSTLIEIAKASLTATAAPTPAVIISSATVSGNPSLNAPNGLCFDDVGNLAAVNSAGAFGIAFFGVKQLVTGAPTPDTFIVGAATTLNVPAGCRFGPLTN